MISVKIAEKDIEKHILQLKALNKKLESMIKDVSRDTSLILVRSLEKEVQKINDCIKLIEETGFKNIVEIKVYVYEIYNTVPGDLEEAYREVAAGLSETGKLAKLKRITEDISKAIENFWYFVNQ